MNEPPGVVGGQSCDPFIHEGKERQASTFRGVCTEQRGSGGRVLTATGAQHVWAGGLERRAGPVACFLISRRGWHWDCETSGRLPARPPGRWTRLKPWLTVADTRPPGVRPLDTRPRAGSHAGPGLGAALTWAGQEAGDFHSVHQCPALLRRTERS